MVFTASTSFDRNGKLTVMPADMRFLEMLPTAVSPVSCSIRTNCLLFFLLAVSSFFCEFLLRFVFAGIAEGSCVNAHDGGWALATSFV
jgi:hypothetical protein